MKIVNWLIDRTLKGEYSLYLQRACGARQGEMMEDCLLSQCSKTRGSCHLRVYASSLSSPDAHYSDTNPCVYLLLSPSGLPDIDPLAPPRPSSPLGHMPNSNLSTDVYAKDETLDNIVVRP